jgi:integrase
MPRKAREITALEVRRLTKPGLYFVGEVPGLALQVLPSGGRTWILRTTIGGRRRDMGLGGFPEITLATAKTRARSAREAISEGVDPIEQRRAAKMALRASDASAVTFDEAVRAYLSTHRAGWRNAKHADQWATTLNRYASPYIGGLNVADIRMPHVLKVLEQPVDGKRLWESRTETATRLRSRIELVLDWCKGRGYREGENPAAWRGNLDAQLPKPTRLKKVAHHAAVAIDEMGSFMSALRKREGIAARALEFTILTAARSGEVRGMVWSEIDMHSGVWTVPGSRMKAGREHRVPLSDAALSILKALPRFVGEDFVFPAPRGGMLSDMSLSAVMRRMGRTEVPHGFRSTFRDWAAERTAFPSEISEMALAHAISTKVEAAYRRSDLMAKRRLMMAEWAQFCGEPSPEFNNLIGLPEADE